MNKDDLLALVGPIVALFGPVGVKYGFSVGDETAFLTGLIGLGWTVAHLVIRRPQAAPAPVPAPAPVSK